MSPPEKEKNTWCFFLQAPKLDQRTENILLRYHWPTWQDWMPDLKILRRSLLNQNWCQFQSIWNLLCWPTPQIVSLEWLSDVIGYFIHMTLMWLVHMRYFHALTVFLVIFRGFVTQFVHEKHHQWTWPSVDGVWKFQVFHQQNCGLSNLLRFPFYLSVPKVECQCLSLAWKTMILQARSSDFFFETSG